MSVIVNVERMERTFEDVEWKNKKVDVVGIFSPEVRTLVAAKVELENGTKIEGEFILKGSDYSFKEAEEEIKLLFEIKEEKEDRIKNKVAKMYESCGMSKEDAEELFDIITKN